MTTASARVPAGAGRQQPVFLTAAGLVAFAAVGVAGLTWAKWDPYGHKVAKLWHSHHWSGASILAVAGKPAAAPSWHGAWSFTVTYGKAVWVALVAALVISAAFEALVPHRRVVALLTRRTVFGGAVVAGLLAVPCMMCTCCSAPIAATLRRRGVPTGSVLGYWLGNPVLNPAVLVFLALVAPWQWVVTRLVVGVVLVVGAATAVGHLAGRRPESTLPAPFPAGDDADGPVLRDAPRRFVETLGRLSVVLIPEYFVVVLAVGAFRGWLLPLGASAAHWGILAVLVAAGAGTLLVVPTAGEIPVLQGLAALGIGAGPLGALLLTLPAVSAPSMAMVGRALSWRVTLFTAAFVACAGVAGGLLLSALR